MQTEIDRPTELQPQPKLDLVSERDWPGSNKKPDQPDQPDERFLHNLEHGGVWISYNPDKANKDTIDKLTTLTKSYSSKVILSPRKADDKAIALASWGRLMTLDSFDEAKIRDFIARNKNKGPEQVPDM